MNKVATFDFSTYHVIITGGSKGIGRAMALAFAQAGAAVSVCARGEEALAEVHQAITDAGAKAHTQSCDLANPNAVINYIGNAATSLGGIDVLINNASGYGFRDEDADWEANFNVDLMAAVRASRAALPHLKSSGKASILHTSSIAALWPRPTGPSYGAIKAALCHFTTSQALQLAQYGIRANALAPGSIEFKDGVWDRCKHENPDLYSATLAKIPFGRFGNPEEVANVTLFLASPLASWITGQTLCVDGGQSLNG